MTQQQPGGRRGQPRAQLQLQPRDIADRMVNTGFQNGCSNPTIHLGLRFRGQPGTAVDGRPFPRAEWEQSPWFVPDNWPIALAGIAGVSPASIAMPPTSWLPSAALRRARWTALVRAAPAVTAQWFVMHDTAGGTLPTRRTTGASGGVHLFLDDNRPFLNNDFATPGRATRCERLHPEFRGQFLHLEIVNTDGSQPRRNPPDVYHNHDYMGAAYAYVWASYRARSWLTVTCHLETDRGIDGAHSDPRGWVYQKMYDRIGILVPSVRGKTFGILQARIGDNTNQANFKNTFPAQYGPIELESRVRRP